MHCLKQKASKFSINCSSSHNNIFFLNTMTQLLSCLVVCHWKEWNQTHIWATFLYRQLIEKTGVFQWHFLMSVINYVLTKLKQFPKIIMKAFFLHPYHRFMSVYGRRRLNECSSTKHNMSKSWTIAASVA